MVMSVWLLRLLNSPVKFTVSTELYTWTHCGQMMLIRKNTDAVSTDDDPDDDTVYYVNSDLVSNIDELAGLLESDSGT